MKGVEGILQHNPDIRSIYDNISSILKEGSVTRTEHVVLYEAIYSYCLKSELSSGNVPDQEVINTLNYNGVVLYDVLRHLFVSHFHERKRAISENGALLLPLYMSAWKKTFGSAEKINSACSYLNRHWIRRQMAETSKDVCDIFHLIIMEWSKIIYSAFSNRLNSEIFYFINQNRENNGSDMMQVKEYCDHLQFLTLEIRSDATYELSKVFKRDFETPFFDMTKTFYEGFRPTVMPTSKPIDYLRLVKTKIDAEVSRTGEFVHALLASKVRALMEEILIVPYKETISHQFITFIDECDYENIRFLYESVLKQTEIVASLKSLLANHIREASVTIFESFFQREIINPTEFLDLLLRLFTKYDNIVARSLALNPLFCDSKGVWLIDRDVFSSRRVLLSGN